MKRFLSILLTISIVLLGQTFALADDSIELASKDYTTKYPTTMKFYGGGTQASMNGTNYLEFATTFEKAGVYDVTINGCGVTDVSLQITIDGTEALLGTFKQTCTDWKTYKDQSIGTTSNISAGEHTVRVTVKSGGISLVKTTLTKGIAKFELSSFKANGEVLKDGETITKNTKNIDVVFTDEINESSVDNAVIYIKNADDEELEITTSVNGETLSITPVSGLEYDSSYSVYVSNLSGAEAILETPASISFNTSSELDDVEDIIVLSDEYTAFYPENMSFYKNPPRAGMNGTNYLEFLVNVSTAGAYDFYFKASSVMDSKIIVKVNDKNALTETFPSAEGWNNYNNVMLGSIDLAVGDNTIRITVASGGVSFNQFELKHLSDHQKELLLDKFASTTTTTEVEELFNSYGNMINLYPTTDLATINDISLFYNHFVGVKYDTLDAFTNDYKRYVAFEKLNQGDADAVKTILEDNDACAMLGVDGTILVSIGDYKDDFIADIVSLSPCNTIEAFITEYDVICQKYIEKAFDIDAALSLSDKTAYLGQEVDIPLGLKDKRDNVISYKLTIECDNSKIINSIKDKYFLGSATQTKQSDTIVEVNATLSSASSVASLGDLKFTAPGIAGNYNLYVSGTITYGIISGTKQFSVFKDLEQVEVTLTDKKNTNTSGGGSSSSSGGGGGGTTISSNTSKSTSTPTEQIITTDSLITWLLETFTLKSEQVVLQMIVDFVK